MKPAAAFVVNGPTIPKCVPLELRFGRLVPIAVHDFYPQGRAQATPTNAPVLLPVGQGRSAQ